MSSNGPRKLNCWEFTNCGREKGGLMVAFLGECPVSTTMKYDGLNDGRGAGRACWMVGASGCTRRLGLGSPKSCLACRFYLRVIFEQDEETCFKYFSEPA